MQNTTGRSTSKGSAKGRTPLGFLIAPLIAGRTSAGKVLANQFGDTPLGKRLRRALQHGSLIDGKIKGPRVRLAPGGAVEHVPATVNRSLSSRTARRMLASFLMLVEWMDPETGAACGTKLWQGTQARRIGLSLRRDRLDRLGGVREVQRYLRIFDEADVLGRSQPPGDRVPEHMRAREKLSAFRGGVQRLVSWSYNKVWTLVGAALPTKIRDTLRRWRGITVPKRPPRAVEASRGPVSPPPPALLAWSAQGGQGKPPPL